MIIKKIELDGDQNIKSVTVKMTPKEAALIAKMAGNLNDASADDIVSGGGEAAREIFSALVAGVFNHYWEDGLNDALKEI